MRDERHNGHLADAPGVSCVSLCDINCIIVYAGIALQTRYKEHLMAQKIQTIFVDDIDGGEAEGTVRFALDGINYEIDLSSKHSNELRTTLSKFTGHARKVGGTRRAARRAGRGNASTVDTRKVREWAKKQGIEIKDRGRVPANVVDQYRTTVGV